MHRIFALADLHLSLDGSKPMDIFGEAWRDHADKMADAWDRAVAPPDVVLLPGDLSWARTLESAARDLAWIGARPGRKVLLRGNHDSWWGSAAKVRAALPASCSILQNDALRIDETAVVVGARGWLTPDDPMAGPSDARVYERELERLRLSIAAADRDHGRELPRIAMLHYPPWLEGRGRTEVVDILDRGGVRTCVYGHLHGSDDHAIGPKGRHGNIAYHLVAADYVGFRPVEIEP